LVVLGLGFHAINILYQSLTLANKGEWHNYAVMKTDKILCLN
jgi:hypothetical protein